MRTITNEQLAKYLLQNNLIDFTFTAEPEDVSPEDMENTYDSPGFSEAVKANMKKDYDWGWCCAKCEGSINGITAEDYLGGCSYESKDDFVNNSGYGDDMKQTVANQLAELLRPTIELLAPLFDEQTA